MVKLFFVIFLSLGVSVSAFAQSSNWQKLSMERADEVKTSLMNALKSRTYECTISGIKDGKPVTGKPGIDTILAITNASSQGVYTNVLGQPLIEFRDLDSTSTNYIYETVVDVTTSPDKKAVTLLGLKQTVSRDITKNTGTINIPKYETVREVFEEDAGRCL